MTSTKFTVGLDGSKNSSKVLKPPGGGSSDIFGFGTSGNSVSNGNTAQEKYKSTAHAADTQSRLFGNSNDVPPVPKSNRVQSNVFESENPSVVRSVKKKYVRRNPITGEEIEIDPEKYLKSESGIKDENGDKEDLETLDEEKSEKLPSKPIQTSIRVRNPPGGKSSGIF